MSETTDEFLKEMREYAGYFTQFITRVEVDRLFALATRGAKIPDALAEAEAKLVKAIEALTKAADHIEGVTGSNERPGSDSAEIVDEVRATIKSLTDT